MAEFPQFVFAREVLDEIEEEKEEQEEEMTSAQYHEEEYWAGCL